MGVCSRVQSGSQVEPLSRIWAPFLGSAFPGQSLLPGLLPEAPARRTVEFPIRVPAAWPALRSQLRRPRTHPPRSLPPGSYSHPRPVSGCLLTSFPQSFQRIVLHFVHHFSCFLLEDWFIRSVSLLEMKPWKPVLTFRIISQPGNQGKRLFYVQMQPAPLQLPDQPLSSRSPLAFYCRTPEGPGNALNMLSGDASGNSLSSVSLILIFHETTGSRGAKLSVQHNKARSPEGSH